MTYKLEFLPSARKEWDKLGHTLREQFKKKLAERLELPRVPSDSLHGRLLMSVWSFLWWQWVSVSEALFTTEPRNVNSLQPFSIPPPAPAWRQIQFRSLHCLSIGLDAVIAVPRPLSFAGNRGTALSMQNPGCFQILIQEV